MASHAMSRPDLVRERCLRNGSTVRMSTLTRRGRGFDVVAEFWDGACWLTRSYIARDREEANTVFAKFVALAKDAPSKRR